MTWGDDDGRAEQTAVYADMRMAMEAEQKVVYTDAANKMLGPPLA